MEVLTDCRRCDGAGTLSIKLGAPDPKRDTHAPYKGAWYTFPPVRCPVCRGTGTERLRPNQAAGWRMAVNNDGYIISKRRFDTSPDGDQKERHTWISNG